MRLSHGPRLYKHRTPNGVPTYRPELKVRLNERRAALFSLAFFLLHFRYAIVFVRTTTAFLSPADLNSSANNNRGSTMALVKEGDTITLHYRGSLDDGTVFDSSEGREPLSFKVGGGEVIQGFDDGVRGMAVGESRQINIPADQAYGEYYEELVRVVPRSGFPPDTTPAIGLAFEMELPDGESMTVRIIDVEGDDVTLDANHLLAGEALHFDVRLVSIDNE